MMNSPCASACIWSNRVEGLVIEEARFIPLTTNSNAPSRTGLPIVAGGAAAAAVGVAGRNGIELLLHGLFHRIAHFVRTCRCEHPTRSPIAVATAHIRRLVRAA